MFAHQKMNINLINYVKKGKKLLISSIYHVTIKPKIRNKVHFFKLFRQ